MSQSKTSQSKTSQSKTSQSRTSQSGASESQAIINDAERLQHLTRDDDCKVDRYVNQINWAVIKFMSPEDMIQKKQIFDLNRFLFHNVNQQLVDMCNNICLTLTNEFTKRLEEKITECESESKTMTPEELPSVLKGVQQCMTLDPEEMSTKVLRQYGLDQEELTDRFETYKVDNWRDLETEFGEQVSKRSCLRGFKISGAFETFEEARKRAAHVTRNLEPQVAAAVVPTNVWVPWDANPDAAESSEYQLDELNDMMGKYKENVKQKNEFFEKRTRQMIDQAREANNEKLKTGLLTK